MSKHLIITIILGIILGIIFNLFPNLDIWVTSFFFSEEQNYFIYGDNDVVTMLHKSVRYITITTIICLLFCAVYHMVKKRPLFGITYKHVGALILILALGPGLLVNGILKEYWGRARPHHVELFGGDKTFSPALVITDQCEGNCSFVSGDAAVGFFFLSLGLLFNRKRWWILGGVTSITFASARVVQGAHFLSDVLFSGIFTYLTAILVIWYMFHRRKSSST